MAVKGITRSIVFLGVFALQSLNQQKALANECSHNENNFRCVKFIDNYDGDTITVNIPRVHHFFGKKVPIRVYGVDTPERKSQDFREKTKALEAMQVTHDLLSRAREIELRNAERGKYFRVVAEVYYDGHNLGQALIDRGLAVPYYGDEKPLVNWCR
ncbi:MAG: thermonuclease family protein [Bdellovibrionales bacterium]|nr:thermonuclease family protein [Bdellovibrionales bacterium]